MENESLNNLIGNIKMYKVDSSNIDYIGYENDHMILKVVFKNGTSYAYFGVTDFVWKELLEATSKGSYLNESIIKRSDLYKYVKL